MKKTIIALSLCLLSSLAFADSKDTKVETYRGLHQQMVDQMVDLRAQANEIISKQNGDAAALASYWKQYVDGLNANHKGK